jgi:hypothetical protein
MKIIEGHQVTVTSKNEQIVLVDVCIVPVSRSGERRNLVDYFAFGLAAIEWRWFLPLLWVSLHWIFKLSRLNFRCLTSLRSQKPSGQVTTFHFVEVPIKTFISILENEALFHVYASWWQVLFCFKGEIDLIAAFGQSWQIISTERILWFNLSKLLFRTSSLGFNFLNLGEVGDGLISLLVQESWFASIISGPVGTHWASLEVLKFFHN